MNTQIQMLANVASAFGEHLDEFVFVGGCCTFLYLDEAASYVRPTDDVDCIVEVSSRRELNVLEKKLRSLGFTHNMSMIARWNIGSLVVDIMPTDPSVLGFGNAWYEAGYLNKTQFQLLDDVTINIMQAPYFLATKLEAVNGRGGRDLRLSHDLEDIFIIIDGRDSLLQEITNSGSDIKKYLSLEAKSLLKKKNIDELIDTHLSAEGAGRIKRSKGILEDLSRL